MDLEEVSILDDTKTPAYEGTLIMARDGEEKMQFRAEPFIDDVETVTEVEEPEEPEAKEPETAEPETEPENTRENEQPKQQDDVVNNIDYSKYTQIIAEMKED